jgi:hypothetical protein
VSIFDIPIPTSLAEIRARIRTRRCPGCGLRPPRPRGRVCQVCLDASLDYCPRCETVKPRANFRGRVGDWCRPCHNQRRREQRGSTSKEAAQLAMREAARRGNATRTLRRLETLDEIRRLQNAGLDNAAIGARLGISAHAARLRLTYEQRRGKEARRGHRRLRSLLRTLAAD